MNWLQYYEAVKRGDVETVKRATDKDCTIPLSMNKNAIEIAALHGHQKLVEYFLDVAEGERRKRGRCHKALEESLRGGHYELSKYLLTRSGLDAKEPQECGKNRTLIEAAIEGKNIQCLEMMWRYSSNDEYRWAYASAAFCSGSSEMMNSVHEFSVPLLKGFMEYGVPFLREPHSGYCYDVKVPPIYTYLGLGRYKRGMKYTLGDRLMKHEIYSDWQRSYEDFTLLDAAGYFGHLDILKLQIEDLQNETEEHREAQLQSVLKFALRNNHKNIVKHLVEEAIVVPLPPYEYEGFNINEAFEYLRDVTSDVVMDEISGTFIGNIEKRLHVLPMFGEHVIKMKGTWDTTLSTLLDDKSGIRYTKIEEYYDYLLDVCSGKMREEDLGGFFMEALSEQNVDAALCFLKRVVKVDCRSKRYHEHFTNAMSASDACFDVITSPVVVELLLSTLNGARRCSCLHRLDPLRKFLRGPCWGAVECLGGRMPNHQPFPERAPSYAMETYARYARVVLEVLFRYGIPKPRSKLITNFMKELFAWRCLSTPTAAKVLCLLECCKTNLSEIRVRMITPLWFIAVWSRMNEVLTYFLVALSRNTRKGRIMVDYMLMYIFDCPKLRKHYLNVFQKIGILVDDSQFGNAAPGRMQYLRKEEIVDFTIVLAECMDRVPSLQDLVRSRINRLLLNIAHRSSSYVSVQTLIDRVTQDLPKPVQEFMNFEDVFRTLPYEGYWISNQESSEELSRIAFSDEHRHYIQNLYPSEGETSDEG